jgi:hypothetical protein
MTPFEMELLKISAPWLAGILATCGGVAITVVKLYMTSIVNRIGDISTSVQTIGAHMHEMEGKIREELSAIRLSTQHRDDVMAGNLASRIEGIERVCETQHGILMNRRTQVDDRRRPSAEWAQNSDISGIKTK